MSSSIPSATTRTLARQLGVSQSTVSRALRDDPRVSESTRRRVRDAAAAADYRRNPVMAELMAELRRRGNRYRGNLAWISNFQEPDHWRTAPYLQEIFIGATKQAEAMGYLLDEISVPALGGSDQAVERVLKARGIRGLVLSGVIPPEKPLKLAWRNLAVILIAHDMADTHFARVDEDDFGNKLLAHREARRLGYDRPAYVQTMWNGREDDRDGIEHASGWRTAAGDPASYLALDPADSHRFKRFAAWFREFQPDALLINDHGLLPHIQTLTRSAAPIGLMHAHAVVHRPAENWAGLDCRQSILGATAVQMLVTRLEHHQFGPLDYPVETQVGGRWVAGASMPPKNRLDLQERFWQGPATKPGTF